MTSHSTIFSSLLLPIKQRFTLPQSLIYFVTSRCNADCDFCLYHDYLNNIHPEHIELSPEEVEKIAANYGSLHYLGLSGGEPFVRKDISSICQTFIDWCSVKVIDVPSNFYFGERMIKFTQDLLLKNKNLTLDFQLSLDHLDEKHDSSRKVKGLYQRATENFRTLYKMKESYPNLMLKINLVFLESNKRELHNILRELRNRLPFDRIQLTYPHYLLNSSTENPKDQLEDVKMFLELAELADSMANKVTGRDLYVLGLRSVKKVYRKLLHDAVSGEKNTGSYCEAGKHIAVMNETGDVFPCEMLWGEKIGNVRQNDYSIGKILASDAYRKFRDKYLGRNNQCNCTWSCAQNTEVSVNYKHYPALALNALSLLRKND